MRFKMSVGSRKWNEYIELFVLNYSDLDFRVYLDYISEFLVCQRSVPHLNQLM